MADEQFESSDSGASMTTPIQASALKKNGFVVLKGFPCKVMEIATSKTGKHGHAKVHLVGIDIFTGKKYEDISPSTHNMDQPNIGRAEYSLLDIKDDGFVSLLDASGGTKEDLKLPLEAELAADLKAAFEKSAVDSTEVLVTVVSAMGSEQIISFKSK